MCVLGHVAQSVTCLFTDTCLTADQGVVSLIPARSHTFVDHEIIFTAILLPSADSRKIVVSYRRSLRQACSGKSMVTCR